MLILWLGSMAALAAVNVGLWIWMARSVSVRTRYSETQLLLSGGYVGVCGFRSLFPRVDLERVCVWDTWCSAILLGRSAATVAELCFALQCALCVRRLSEITAIPLLGTAAYAFVPLAVVAELLCWYAVLSVNHIRHAAGESLWAVMLVMLPAALGTAAFVTQGPLRVLVITGFLIYGVGSVLMMTYDVTMYVHRWRQRAAGVQLTLTTGLRDSLRRRHPTLAWNVWREEAPWMTLYFSVGVWTSLAMALLEGAISRP